MGLLDFFKLWWNRRLPPAPPLTPVKFPEANKNLLKPGRMTDDEYSSLWVYTDGNECLSCWKMNWRHRLNALLFGRVWLCVLSGKTQPPVWLDCDKSVFKE